MGAPWRSRASERAEHGLDDADRFPVFVERKMLSRRVIEGAIAGTVSDDGAAPHRADDVHVAGTSLEDETWLETCVGGADRRQKASDQCVVPLSAPWLFPSPE